MHTLSDTALTRLMAKGDERSFTEIYRRYAEQLADHAATRLPDLEDARDLLHDLFAELWKNRKSLNIEKNLQGYLYTALNYKIVDRVRKNITREKYAEMVQALRHSFEPAIDELIYAKETAQLVEKALGELPQKTQEIFRLSRKEHRSIAEIARIMGLSEQTIKNQLTIALNHLRTALSLSMLTLMMADYLQ